MSGRGYRRFKSLRKFKNFLGLSYRYNEAAKLNEPHGPRVPKWSKKGICKYKKVAYLATPKMRGDRELGKKILRRYVYEP